MKKISKFIALLVTMATIATMSISAFAANGVELSFMSQDKETGKASIGVVAEAGDTVTVFKTIGETTSEVGSFVSTGTKKEMTLMFTQLSCETDTEAKVFAETETGVKSNTLTLNVHGPHVKSDSWTTTKTASCTENGTAVKKCVNCDKVLETKTLEGKGHNYGEPSWIWGEDYTSCTAVFTCKKDSSHTVSVVTKAVTVSRSVDATCVSSGSKTYSAAVTFNNKTYNVSKTVTTPKLQHELSNWMVTVQPTCTTEGTRVKKCTVCRDIITTEQIPAIDHKYEISYQWSADNDSCTATAVCQNDKTHTVTETAKGLDKILQEATCKKAGKLTRTATFKNDLFKAQTKNATITGSHVDADKNGICDVCYMNLKNSVDETTQTTTSRNFFEGLFNKEEKTTVSEAGVQTTAPEEMVTSYKFEEDTKEPPTVTQPKEKVKIPTVTIIVLVAIGIGVLAAVGGIVMLVRDEKKPKGKKKKQKRNDVIETENHDV